MVRLFLLAAALVAGLTSARAATVDISVSEENGAVVFTGSGSFDLSQMSPVRLNFFNPNRVVTQDVLLAFGGNIDSYFGPLTFFEPLAPGTPVFLPSTVTGDLIGLNSGGDFGITAGYQSNDPLSFRWTVENATIAGLGLTFGPKFVIGGNTIALNSAVVPLPATALLLLGALAGLGLAARRRA